MPPAVHPRGTSLMASHTKKPRLALTCCGESMNVVCIRGVTKNFGLHTAVDDLSLDVPAGSIYGFLGPNGSGKTTTLRMIMHILHPDQGEITVLGQATF